MSLRASAPPKETECETKRLSRVLAGGDGGDVEGALALALHLVVRQRGVRRRATISVTALVQ